MQYHSAANWRIGILAYWHIILHKSLKKKRESLFFSQSFFYFTEKHYLCALFYTGKSTLVDTAGRVDKFMSRYGDRKKK